MDTPRIIFEDNHLLVAYKPKGYLSQSDGSDAPDMLNFLKSYIKEKYNKPGNVFLGLLHRLDRNVEGVMVFAKTGKCASRLSEQIRRGDFDKRYEARVQGKLTGSGRLVNYLVKDGRTNKVTVYDKEVPGSKRCELEYKAIGYKDGFTTVDIKLLTGRSHQIRSQFAHAGHPLLGDTKYGGRRSDDGISLKSYFISFNHPVSGDHLEFTV